MLGLLFSARFADAAVPSSLDAGQHLFHQGDLVRFLFVVETGRLRLARHTVDGHPLTLQTANPGETLAEASLFSPRYHCDALADVPSRVCGYPKGRILSLFAEDPGFARDVTATLARQVIDIRTRLELRNVRAADERTLLFLEFLADPAGTVRRDRPLKDMAAEIGLTHEAFYRALALLERRGAIIRATDMIRIIRR